MRSPDDVFRDGRTYEGPDRRMRDDGLDELEPVVLTRKLAEAIDGIDLVGRHVGDRLALMPREASLLIAEGWAERPPLEQRRRESDDEYARSRERVA